jgi:aspartate ammonia-lyase
VTIPDKQVGSSIMPGKINPVVPEFVISASHQIYSNDQLISSLSGQGCLDLNAYIPSIGTAMIRSLELLIALNKTLLENLLQGLIVNPELSSRKLFLSPAITTSLSPLIGYHKSSELAKYMKETGKDVFDANIDLQILPDKLLKKIMTPEFLIKKGFSMSDIRDFKDM